MPNTAKNRCRSRSGMVAYGVPASSGKAFVSGETLMNRNFVVRCAPLIGALLLVADVSPLHLAHGQTWKLATGGDWGNANNWKNPAAVPDNGATVIFPDGLAGN